MAALVRAAPRSTGSAVTANSTPTAMLKTTASTGLSPKPSRPGRLWEPVRSARNHA
jgi:hypothetical protein